MASKPNGEELVAPPTSDINGQVAVAEPNPRSGSIPGEPLCTMGQEMEFAIRYTPSTREPLHPGNEWIFTNFKRWIESSFATQPGDRLYGNQFFVENGGAFYYEFLPSAVDGGLIETATPECASPGECLLYQRAMESILIRALPDVRTKLQDQGFRGTLGLIKNCRDAEGHIYGAQENYEVTIATGWRLMVFKALTILTGWLCLLSPVLMLLVLVPCFILLFLLSFFAVLLRPVFRGLASATGLKAFEFLTRQCEELVESGGNMEQMSPIDWKLVGLVTVAIQVVAYAPFITMLNCLAFRRERNALTAFLASRCIVTGAGCLLDDDRFALSEKGTEIRTLSRRWGTFGARALFDWSNLMKGPIFSLIRSVVYRFEKLFTFSPDGLIGFLRGPPGNLDGILSERQRLQIGMSDANRCDVAEYLKLGITQLLMTLAQRGTLEDAPRLRKPVSAIRRFALDPSLTEVTRDRSGREWTALQLQRWFLDRAWACLKTETDLPQECYEVVVLWQEVLDALEEDPGKLIGRIDWVTKRYLLETAGADLGPDGRKKIDIKYHELGTGYHDLLTAEGIAVRMVTDEDIDHATREAPSPESAQARARLIRSLHYRGLKKKVSWSSQTVGDWEPNQEGDLA